MDAANSKESAPPPIEYPRTYRKFIEMFPDNSACSAYLERIRWPQGFICPTCKMKSTPWHLSRGRLLCPICRHQTTVTAGTIFDKTRTPLTTWFEAAWHVTTAKNGMSAKTLEQTLGVQYRVAWTMLQRFRVAMVRTERECLSGEVEVDETFVGGAEEGGKRGRGSSKSIVVIAVEIKQPKGFGRIRMRHIHDASADSLVPFIADSVVQGSTVLTDGWGGYNCLSDKGYAHKKIILSSTGDPAHISMPGVHQVAGLFKRWLLGTHQGAVSEDHLQSYLEEFTFRFNRRTSGNRGHVFKRLLEQAATTNPVTEAAVTHGYNWNQAK